ncbi:MAG TPA: 3-oxoacyl-ACP reductase, partial [Roseovarius nubinhibens]|nr:3-oxoacyl-ACP reductase [Roseovarius nubinhibens]
MTKTAIVTGAARGIGLATTELLLEDGWQVAMVDWDADELARATEGRERILALPLDVSKPDQVAEIMARTKEAFGGIDALINNAGVADFGPIEETDFARWRRVMETNLDGVFLMTQAATPMLRASGQGAIVNIASISGLRASTLRVA